VGVTDGVEALEKVGGDISDPLQAVEAALLLLAPMSDRFHLAVEQSARIGGSTLGALAGAVVGARVGIKAWPWAFANDTWFAEIGRRLVRGPDDLDGLPIPYAVEQHLMFGPRPGFH
jgi:ADP-ribosylglycohydrolase